MTDLIDAVRKVTEEFCAEFTANPYLCYTEHGLHAFFHTLLFNALPVEQRYITWQDRQVCVIQKEYPTARKLDKPRRQHWDIAVIKSPPQSLVGGPAAYDYLKLAAVVEFGMNETEEHLTDDIERLCHRDANLEHRFAVHLYRLSEPGAKFSGRDWSSNSPRILSKEHVAKLTAKRPIEVYYGIHDSTGKYASGVWLIRRGTISPLT